MNPTDEGLDPAVLAAIVAAVEATWPRPTAAPGPTVPRDPSSWRFSARWWARPAADRRARPW